MKLVVCKNRLDGQIWCRSPGPIKKSTFQNLQISFQNIRKFRQDAGDIAPKMSKSLVELEKAATKIGKKLNADVVLVQKNRPFSFPNLTKFQFQPEIPKIIKNKLKRAKSSLIAVSTSISDWTNQTLNPERFRNYIKNVRNQKQT